MTLKKRLWKSPMLIAVFLAVFATVVFAQHVDELGLFELEGDATSGDGPFAGDDWQNLVSPGSTNPNFHTWTGIIQDQPPGSTSDPTTFTTGGSKDIYDISSWRWNAGSVPAKDDITNAYAAAYTAPADGAGGIKKGDLIIYFGADRFANNGSAQLGFWFLQGSVTNQPGGTFGPSVHTNGDILVLANFTIGGSVASIEVLEWENGALNTTPTSTATCNTGTAALACAITNSAPVQLYWPYIPKSPFKGAGPFGSGKSACATATNCAPPVSFFEGGIDITAILGSTPCLATFVAETRSSTSTSAELEDFVIGGFSVCGFRVTKQCPSVSVTPDGTKLRYTFGGAVKNTGIGTLTNVTITDTFPADATNITPGGTGAGTVRQYDIGSLNAGQCLEWPSGNTCTNAFPADQPAADFSSDTFDSATNMAHNMVTDAIGGGITGTDSSGNPLPITADCLAGPGAALFVTKGCTTSFNYGGTATVSFTGSVCNESAYEITGLTGTDSQTDSLFTTTIGPGGTPTFVSASLAPCNTPAGCSPKGTPCACTSIGTPTACTTFSGSYMPSVASEGMTACTDKFDDKVTVMGNFLGGSVSNSNTAGCPLCGKCP